MEKDLLESWLHNPQFPNAKSSKLPPYDIGTQNSLFPCTHAGLSSLPMILSREMNEPHGWFHSLSNFKPKPDPSCKVPVNGSGSKQFLVFDQTGNKTTMMFSSGVDTSIPQSTTLTREALYSDNFNENGHYSGANLTDEHGSVVGSDMREDSEEIDALLYSDEEDDNYSDDGVDTSTGHSPSTMTAYKKHHHDSSGEEVASSAGFVKRRKLSESDYQVTKRSLEYEDDAESSCIGGTPTPVPFTETGKRMRRDEIREAVDVLRMLLPSGKGKDEVMVLEEGINYLKALKLNAGSLGLSGVSDCPLDG